MKITEVKIANSTVGKKLLLVDVQPYYIYKDGQRTETVEGYRYTVVMQEHAFDKLAIKIPGAQQMETPDGYVEVVFDGLELYIYWRAGSYDVGAIATGIHPIK